MNPATALAYLSLLYFLDIKHTHEIQKVDTSVSTF